MCGRFSLTRPGAELAAALALDAIPERPPRYTIAPTQEVVAVRASPAGRELAVLRWGLVPPGASGPKAGPPLLNARAETAADKLAFRSAFARRRCLIP